MLLTGPVFIYRAARRRFDRTNEFGRERYASLAHRFRAQLLDAILWSIGLGSIGLALGILVFEHAPEWGVFAMLVVFSQLIDRALNSSSGCKR